MAAECDNVFFSLFPISSIFFQGERKLHTIALIAEENYNTHTPIIIHNGGLGTKIGGECKNIYSVHIGHWKDHLGYELGHSYVVLGWFVRNW